MLQVAARHWSNAEIHDTVAAIAAVPEYATPLRRSLAGRLFRYLYQRVSDLFDLFRDSRDARFLGVAAAVVLVVVIVARIVVTRRLDEQRRRADEQRGGRGGRRGAADLWATANAFAAAGNYTAATHALYAAVIDSLAREGKIALHSSKTSGDYARELRRRGSPAARDFAAFARGCDRVIFGVTSATAEDYAALAGAAERSVRGAAAA